MKPTLPNETLINLAEKHGTPLFIYDLDKVKEQYESLFEIIEWPKLKIFYAMKTNYNIDIMKLLLSLGSSIDTVSPGEVHYCLKLGFPKEKILYTANHLTDEEMREVADLGVLLNIGSLSRLRKYAKEYPNTKVCVRFNPNVVDGGHEYIKTGGDLTKFGILLADADEVKSICDEEGITVVGLHEHTGSALTRESSVYDSMKNLLEIAHKFPDLEFVDFGGGFKVPYKPDEEGFNYEAFGKEITEIFSKFCDDYGRELEMRFEPGRYIVGEAGVLVTQVNTLKDNNGHLIAGTDSGFNHLIRPILYQAYHHIVNLSNEDGEKKKYDISGNICESGDLFASQREVAEIKEGDYLGIMTAGAYAYVMGSIYNLRSMPSEVVVEKGEARLSTKRKTHEEMAEDLLK